MAEVLYLKPGEQKNFCIVDAAMNDLPRPAMYQAYHQIVPLQPRAEATGVWEVWGRFVRAATGSATTAPWRRTRATCWRCCRPAPTA